MPLSATFITRLIIGDAVRGADTHLHNAVVIARRHHTALSGDVRHAIDGRTAGKQVRKTLALVAPVHERHK